jgi:hypothetical protein
VGEDFSTSQLGATATQAQALSTTVTAYQTSVPAGAAYTSTASLSAYFPYASTLATTISSTSNAAGAQSAATYPAAPAPADQTSSSGPGTGEIVGSVLGAIAVVLIFAIFAFLYWRRTRKQSCAFPPETTTTTVQEFGENNWRPDLDKEVKPMTTTKMLYSLQNFPPSKRYMRLITRGNPSYQKSWVTRQTRPSN